MKSYFCCPVCHRPLNTEEKRLFCPEGHSFDKASSGYVNLLIKKGGGEHGDNKLMIRARKAFLEEGHYLPLRDALISALKEQAPQTLFDAGCGEGWYTAGMAEALPGCGICGADISGAALSYAAKRLGNRGETAVASLYDLPLPDGAFDGVTLLFSPLCREEFYRILKKNGKLYMAIPGKRHLWGLKQLLYNQPYENRPADFALEGFTLEKEEHILFEKEFSGKTLSDLFAMTPYYYRTPPSGRARAERLVAEEKVLKTELEFHLLVYRKV